MFWMSELKNTKSLTIKFDTKIINTVSFKNLFSDYISYLFIVSEIFSLFNLNKNRNLLIF